MLLLLMKVEMLVSAGSMVRGAWSMKWIDGRQLVLSLGQAG